MSFLAGFEAGCLSLRGAALLPATHGTIVDSCHLARGQDGTPKGSAFVVFHQAVEGHAAAMALHNQSIVAGAKPLCVRQSNKRPVGGSGEKDKRVSAPAPAAATPDGSAKTPDDPASAADSSVQSVIATGMEKMQMAAIASG
jgi:hypothetical protein